MAAGGRKGNLENRGGVIGGIAPPEKKVDAFPLMSFVKNNCVFGADDYDDEESVDIFSKSSEEAVRAAKNRRFQDFVDQAAALNLKSEQASASDLESEERQKQALQKIHEMEWKRNQKDTWKVQQPKPVKEQDYGGFLRPLEKTDVGEYFSGTRKIKPLKEHKRNRTVSEVRLLDDGKIQTVNGETTNNTHTKQVVTNLPMRQKVSVPSKGLPFTPGPPVANTNNVWMQRKGSELFSDIQTSTITAYGVCRDEDEAIALAIAESIRTAKEEQNLKINMQQLYAQQFHSTLIEPTKLSFERPPPDPEGTIWDCDEIKTDKHNVPSNSFKDDDAVFYPGSALSYIADHDDEAYHDNNEDNASLSKAVKARPKVLHDNGNSMMPREQRNSHAAKFNQSVRDPWSGPNKSTAALQYESQMCASKPVKDDRSGSGFIHEADTLTHPRSKPNSQETFIHLGSPTEEKVPASLQKKPTATSYDSQNHESCIKESPSINGRELLMQHTSSKASSSLQKKPTATSHDSLNRGSSVKDSLSLNERVLLSVQHTSSNASSCSEDSLCSHSLDIDVPCDIDEMISEQAEPDIDLQIRSSEDKPVRLPQTMPSLMMAMKSNKACLPHSKVSDVREEPMLGQTDMKLDNQDPLSSLPAKDEEQPLEPHDINANLLEAAENSNNRKESDVNPFPSVPMPMPMTGMPWQYPPLSLPFNTGMPPIFPPVFPQLNSQLLNMTPQLNANTASQIASQAQLASMQMMLMQQAMGCLPGMFPSVNQNFSAPQNSTPTMFPTLGHSVRPEVSLPAAGSNSITGFGAIGAQGNPVQQFNHQLSQTGQFCNAPASVTPPIGKGRGRLNRQIHAQYEM